MANYKKKYSQHQWPTNGVTKKQLDRAIDKLYVKMDRLVARNRELSERLRQCEYRTGLREPPSPEKKREG